MVVLNLYQIFKARFLLYFLNFQNFCFTKIENFIENSNFNCQNFNFCYEIKSSSYLKIQGINYFIFFLIQKTFL